MTQRGKKDTLPSEMTPQVRKLRAIAYYSRVWASGLVVRAGIRSPSDRMLRPRITGDVPRATAHELVEFVEATGGDVEAYRLPDGSLLAPHTWFATWGPPELARALLAARLPLSFSHVVHASASARIHRLPSINEPLRFAATVETVARTGRSVRIEQNLVTTTVHGETLAEQTVSVLLPGGRRPWADKKRRQEAVPGTATLVASHELTRSEGWKFARISGDFNPVHWLPAFARFSGLDNTVAHGFDLFARIGHAAVARLAGNQPARLRYIEARFRQPVVLPAQVSIFAGASERTDTGASRFPLWLAADQGSPANAVAFVEVDS